MARLIVEKTTQERPANATHWSTRTLAKHLGTSRSMVQRGMESQRAEAAFDANVQAQQRPALCGETERRGWIVTIHQPSLEAFRLLDNLILVSKDIGSPEPGHLVYYGPTYPQAVNFFNPNGVEGLRPGAEPSPDEVLRGLVKDKTATWLERYRTSSWKRQFVYDRAGKQPVEPGQSMRRKHGRTLGFGQWKTLVQRCMTIKLHDTANTAILMAQAPVIAILVVLVFGKHAAEKVTQDNWHSVASATSITVFLLALAALWFGCSNSAREIVGEWAVYHRERMVNLKIPSYMGSKFTVLGGLCLLQCSVLLGIVHWGTGLKGPWPAMFVVLLLTALVGLGIRLRGSNKTPVRGSSRSWHNRGLGTHRECPAVSHNAPADDAS